MTDIKRRHPYSHENCQSCAHITTNDLSTVHAAEQAVEVPAHAEGEGEGEVRAEEVVEDTEEVTSFAVAEEMLKKRKQEEEERETNENDDEVAVDENNDVETVDTDSLGSCQDCGFPVYWSKYEAHQYCEGNKWACRFCDQVAKTLTDAKLHVWDKHSYLLRK